MEMTPIKYIGGEILGGLNRFCSFSLILLFICFCLLINILAVSKYLKKICVCFSWDSCKGPLQTYYEIHIVYRTSWKFFLKSSKNFVYKIRCKILMKCDFFLSGEDFDFISGKFYKTYKKRKSGHRKIFFKKLGFFKDFLKYIWIICNF